METKATSTAAHKKEPHGTNAPESGPEPIIVDIGKGSRKDVRKLRKGKQGKLMRRVDDTVEHLRENGALAPDAQVIVVVVRERRKRGALGRMWGMG